MIDNNVFVISDTHFFHYNILKYENRPFDNIVDMNETLISNWNNVVSETDIIYHLGDVALGNLEQVTGVLNRLNGIKILILGNHDKSRGKSKWKQLGFREVYDTFSINNFIFLMHQPKFDNKMREGSIIIHGHTHSKKVQHEDYTLINACVELTNYSPIRLNNLISEYFNYKR